jgi:UDP-N-acetylglucosamine 2-epimerase (non-hydrolysing)
VLVGPDPQRIGAAWRKVLASPMPAARLPDLWDGHAAERIVDVLCRAS